MHPCKGQELPRQRSSSVRRLADLLDTPLLYGILRRGVREYVVIALDYGEQIVEVVRKAPPPADQSLPFCVSGEAVAPFVCVPQHFVDIAEIRTQILRMRNLWKIGGQELLLRVANDLAQRLVHAKPGTVQSDERHSDRGLVEGPPETGFRSPSSMG